MGWKTAHRNRILLDGSSGIPCKSSPLVVLPYIPLSSPFIQALLNRIHLIRSIVLCSSNDEDGSSQCFKPPTACPRFLFDPPTTPCASEDASASSTRSLYDTKRRAIVKAKSPYQGRGHQARSRKRITSTHTLSWNKDCQKNQSRIQPHRRVPQFLFHTPPSPLRSEYQQQHPNCRRTKLDRNSGVRATDSPASNVVAKQPERGEYCRAARLMQGSSQQLPQGDSTLGSVMLISPNANHRPAVAELDASFICPPTHLRSLPTRYAPLSACHFYIALSSCVVAASALRPPPALVHLDLLPAPGGRGERARARGRLDPLGRRVGARGRTEHAEVLTRHPGGRARRMHRRPRACARRLDRLPPVGAGR